MFGMGLKIGSFLIEVVVKFKVKMLGLKVGHNKNAWDCVRKFSETVVDVLSLQGNAFFEQTACSSSEKCIYEFEIKNVFKVSWNVFLIHIQPHNTYCKNRYNNYGSRNLRAQLQMSLLQ